MPARDAVVAALRELDQVGLLLVALPQLAARAAAKGHTHELEEHERVNARLLLGFHL